MYLFDILGVSERETCYANLLSAAFMESNEFQNVFIKALMPGCESAEGWSCHREFRANIFGRSLRPDLLLVNRSLKSVILVEVKVQAGENAKQSSDYASPECRSAMLEQIQLQTEKPFRYVWLTPEGLRPKSPEFIPLRFLALGEALRSVRTGDDNLRQLIGELLKFIDEQEHLKAPMPEENVAGYLRPLHLTTWCQKFERLCKSLLIPIEKQYFERLVNPYYVWILKEDGYILNFSMETPQKRSDVLVLSLQYHCGIGQRLKAMPSEYRSVFKNDRRRFTTGLRSHCGAAEQLGWEWGRGNAEYSVAKVDLRLNAPYSEFANEVQRFSSKMLEAVGLVLPKV
jgi:hypothetical protein